MAVTYSIKDLEQLSGIKSHTIRIWEKRYGIIQPERTDTNYRRYSESQLRKFLNIAYLNARGYKISKLAAMSEQQIKNYVLDTSATEKGETTLIDRLIIAVLESDEEQFLKLFSNVVSRKGLERSIVDLISPLFNKIGLLWQTKTLSSPHEHFASAIVRRKLMAAIDETEILETDRTKPSFLLFLPDNQWHELGLLFAAYVLRKRNYKVIYLGQSLPLDDLTDYKENLQFDCVLTVINSLVQGSDLQDYTNRLSEMFKSKKVFLSGYQFFINTLDFPSNLQWIKSFEDFVMLADSGITKL